ncbi:hypothetical protein M3Y98_00202300 [Aphelenchoides besseyi]|nr:hypothetical protein M3Y98_00202300 [Aphelenchoides besseyi]KAI6200310.1 hypothetical protein M3Y96_00720000 [Aphelenchoides besseyi]
MMEDAWSLSSEHAVREPDPGTAGFQLKSLLNGRPELDRLSPELLREFQDWESRFPNLTVVGTKILPVESNRKQELEMAIAMRVVQLHLWPAIKPYVETNTATEKSSRTAEKEAEFQVQSSVHNLPRIKK